MSSAMLGVVSTVLHANAKLTVSLKIVGARPDGYHLIEAEMVGLAHADVLSFADGDSLTVGGPAAAGVPTDDRNLVRRALTLLGRTAAVHIDKHIRAGGGLGGGSADAAATLRWAGCDDLAIAARLGADVPFCLVGDGHALVSGIGEVVRPIAFEHRDYTLITPPFGVSTVAVFAAWDALGGPVVDGPNDLEPAALQVEPRLESWRDRIEDATGQRPVLAGSGSTWFVEGAHPDLADELVPATVVVTRTDRPSRGPDGR